MATLLNMEKRLTEPLHILTDYFFLWVVLSQIYHAAINDMSLWVYYYRLLKLQPLKGQNSLIQLVLGICSQVVFYME